MIGAARCLRILICRLMPSRRLDCGGSDHGLGRVRCGFSFHGPFFSPLIASDNFLASHDSWFRRSPNAPLPTRGLESVRAPKCGKSNPGAFADFGRFPGRRRTQKLCESVGTDRQPEERRRVRIPQIRQNSFYGVATERVLRIP